MLPCCCSLASQVRKEWQHPTIGNIFTFWPLVLVLVRSSPRHHHHHRHQHRGRAARPRCPLSE